MLYPNFLKPNKTSHTIEAHEYIDKMSQYKFTLMINKGNLKIVAGLLIGILIVVASTFAVMTIANRHIENNEIASLEEQKKPFEMMMQSRQSDMQRYEKMKSACDTIYSIATKTVKWSDIVISVTKPLPYDTVINSIETVDGDTYKKNMSLGEDKEHSVPGSKSNIQSSGGADAIAATAAMQGQNGSAAQEGDVESSTQANGLESNNIIMVKGETMSLVNLSLYMDELQSNKKFFKRIEYKASQISEDADRSLFEIYIFLK